MWLQVVWRVCQPKTKMQRWMWLGKQVYNLLGRRNKRQSESVMLKVMASEVTINFNILSSFMKDKAMNNLNNTLIVVIHKSRTRKINTHINK